MARDSVTLAIDLGRALRSLDRLLLLIDVLTEAVQPTSYAQTLGTAIHEAAHAVIAIKLGCGVERATIMPVTKLAGRKVILGEVSFDGQFRRDAERVVADFAGPTAEALYTDTHLFNKFLNGGGGDLESANAAGFEKREFFDLAAKAVSMVLEAWPAIQLTAAYLIEHGEMTGAEVRRCIKVAKSDERLPALAIARAAAIAYSA